MNTFAIRHPAITPVSPVDGEQVNDPTPILSWQPSSYASNYQLVIQNDIGTSIYDDIIDVETACSSTLCSYEIPIAIEDGSYQWLVRAILSVPGIYGPFSSFEKVTPPGPETYLPMDSEIIYNNNPTFSWYPYQLSTKYTLEISDNSTLENVVFTSINSSYCQDDLCEFKLPIGLNIGEYTWKIQAFWNDSYYTSTDKQFSIDTLPTPTLILPTNNYQSVDTSPLIAWAIDNNPATNSYFLEVIDDSTFDVVYEYSFPKENCVNEECRHQITMQLPPGEYRWHIRAVSNTVNGLCSIDRFFSQEYSPGIPNLLLPQNLSQLNPENQHLVWESGNLAIHHEVEVFNINGTTIGNWIIGNDYCQNSLCTFSIPENIELSTTNQWKVRSIRNDIVSEWE